MMPQASVQLTGNLAQQEARVLVVFAKVGKFAPKAIEHLDLIECRQLA